MKKLPPTLLLALAVEIIATSTFVVWRVTHSLLTDIVSLSMAWEGASLVTYVLAIAGLLEMARRTTGRESLGLRISAAGFGVGIVIMGFWQAVVFVQPQWDGSTFQLLSQWGVFAANAAPLAGLIIATSLRHRTAALVGAGVLVVAAPVPPLARIIYGWITSWQTSIVVEHSLHAGVVVTMLVLAARVAGGDAPRDPDAATLGLRTIGTAIWLRIIGALTLAGLTVMLLLGRASDGSAGILKLATMSYAVVGIIAMIMLARGALGAVRSGIADLPRAPFVASAAGTLWCLGIALYKLPYEYRALYGSHDAYGLATHTEDVPQALSVAMPLVSLAAIAIVATAISGFAARRGLDQLRAEAQGKGTAFVVLMLVSIAVQSWLLPDAGSLGSFAMFTLAAAVAALVATVQMARLCTLAADSLHAEPPLPKATVL
jgi:hypothetical protein